MWTLHLINIVVFIGFLFLAWKKPAVTLILLPFVAAVLFLSGFIFFENEITSDDVFVFYMFPAPVLFLLIGLCLIHWSPSPSQLEIPWYKTVTSVILTMFMCLLILAVFVAVFQLFSIILFIVFLAAVYQFTQAQKFGLAMDIISTIGASIRQSLPLPTALTAAAHGQKKKAARVFNNIAHWLIQGRPLSEALRLGYPKCPSDILASITAGEKMDQLPKAIESLQAGKSLVVFPEGTIPGEENIMRQEVEPDTGLLRGHSGIVRLAIAAKVPIVPVGVSGTGASFPPEVYPRLEVLHMPKNVPVTVRYGKPISFES